jgi:formate C-acetyltransferase
MGLAVAKPATASAYQRRLDALHRTKLHHTAVKRQAGPRDVDDWGQIPLEGRPFTFVPQTDHPRGHVLGPRDCGRNFRRFLAACPTYVDPNSSLLGGYYLTFSPTGWDPECRWDHLVADQERYGIIHGIASTQHFLSDAQIGLDLGWGGILAKIDHHRAINRSEEQQAYYDGLTQFILGVQEWIGAHVAAARQQAATQTDPALRDNLLEMAQLNEAIVAAPPATFRQALQWLAWYQMAKRVYIGGGPIGRIDRLLWPFYRREHSAGTLGDDEAIYHLACFLLKDSAYLQVGGVDERGRDATNALSFLVLEAAHRIQIPANIAVMVHDAMDPALMRRAVELLLDDKMGIPRFAGMDAVIDGFVRRGFPPEAARQRVQAGCHWFCVPGREYGFCDVIKINFAKVFLAALDEMMAAQRPRSVDHLWDLFVKHLGRAIDVVAQGIDIHMENQHRFYPELALSVLCHGPIEKGVDASHGSLEFTNIGVDGAALATAADSFAAIEQRIEQERSVTWDDLRRALKSNWEGEQRIRRLMLGAQGFGRGAIGDTWAHRIARRFGHLVVEKPTPAGRLMSPGLFSWASTIPMGRQTPATPDGRFDGQPISFGANPNAGLLHGGAVSPTAAATAIAAVQCGYGNPAPFQFDVDPGPVVDDQAVAQFDALIRTHFRLGGTLINANVLNRQMVLDACRDPAKYPDLVVRVTGFSAYFASLSDEFRKLVQERILSGG